MSMHPNCDIRDWRLTNVKHPTAIKEHTCSLCFAIIREGMRYTTGAPFSRKSDLRLIPHAKLCPQCRTECNPLPPDLQAKEPKRTTGMNLNNVASIIRDDVVTIVCLLNGSNSKYTFKCTKALADTLQEGDLVLAHVKTNIDIAQVVTVHDECKIDVDSDITYKWAFQRVDGELLTDLQKEDDALTEKLRNHKRQSAREQVLAMFGVVNPQTLLEQVRKDREEGA